MQLLLLSPGDEVLPTICGKFYRIFTKVFENSIKFNFIGMEKVDKIEEHITKNTKPLGETPTNPMLNIIDIEPIAKVAKKHGVLLGD